LGRPYDYTDDERFWLIMGAQTDDPAIRLRVVSQLGLAPTDLQKSRPSRRGLAVCERISRAAKELFQWHGVDVVTANCTQFQSDLDHYAKHLEDYPAFMNEFVEPCLMLAPE